MKPSSTQKAELRYGACAIALIASFGFGANAAHAAEESQPGQTTQAQERRIVIEPQTIQPGTRLNPTGRTVSLTVPAKDGAVYLGDIVVNIDPNDRLEFSAQRLLDLLSNVVDPDVVRTLQGNFAGRTTLSPADFEASGIRIRYNPQDLALELEIASERRATRTVQVSPLDRERFGTFVEPAGVSAYLNIRGNLDYLWEGSNDGLQAPVLFMDGAARLGRIVAESDAIWQPGSDGVDFQRLGSRLVYDDTDNLIRWTAGDLITTTRGFQSGPDIAGISAFRSYSVLQPQQIIRPRGDRSFRLERPSTVEVQVNGQIVRRLQLAPGTYDLRDFPFTQGSNDIRLAILDDAGRTEVLRFNVFLDQSQLARGLTEFGVYAGVLAPLQGDGPNYTDNLAFSGFVRHGVSDFLTLGGNVQADADTRMGGVEAVWATGVGTFGANFSISDIDGFGAGRAALVTFQRLIQRSGGRADSLSLFVESRSRDFGPLGTIIPNNPFKFEVGGGYSHAFSDFIYGGVDGRYSSGRGVQRDVWSVRGTLGYRINPRMSLTSDVRWEQDNIGRRVSGLLSLTVRLGRFSNLRADYDTRFDRARLSYNRLEGTGVGSYNIAADVERNNLGSGVNLVGNYYANRSELGLSHFGTFDDDFGASTNQRTSLRFATSLAIADGSFSMGRPIYDSFAIVKGHRALDGANIYVDPSPFGFTANTGMLGAGTHPSLSSYAERTITVDAPSAPAGFDIGQGSFRVFPPYRSGYLLQVGSDYMVTALGRLINRDGEPVSLVTGTATELAHPEREPLTIFTNREGRFGAVGLAPGRWRIQMNDDLRSSYVINVPESAEGILRVGDISPTESGE
ncbi:MAG TPA: fimbrial biogenesis outer membrane usher protein [Allosphingosinicella sp.]|nr:fimbrial biogenesis outer membrane usher protein [Allosphingosinicella sp.]